MSWSWNWWWAWDCSLVRGFGCCAAAGGSRRLSWTGSEVKWSLKMYERAATTLLSERLCITIPEPIVLMALRWTRSKRERWDGAAHIHASGEYSRWGRTNPLYTASLPCTFRTREAFRRNPTRLLALTAMEWTCVRKERLVSNETPRRFKLSVLWIGTLPNVKGGMTWVVCLRVTIIRWVLDGSNLILHRSPHSSSLSSDSWRDAVDWWISSLLATLYSVVSSAKVASWEPGERHSSISLTYKRNRVGPKMLPCGTPARIGWEFEQWPPITTCIWRLARYDFSQVSKGPCIPARRAL